MGLPALVCRVGVVMFLWGLVAVQVEASGQTPPLEIDPVLVYSTYLGGNGVDQGAGIAVDANGNIFVAGTTTGDFPTVSALQPTGAGVQDVFVAKLTPQGDAVIYSIVIGGHDWYLSRAISRHCSIMLSMSSNVRSNPCSSFSSKR